MILLVERSLCQSYESAYAKWHIIIDEKKKTRHWTEERIQDWVYRNCDDTYCCFAVDTETGDVYDQSETFKGCLKDSIREEDK